MLTNEINLAYLFSMIIYFSIFFLVNSLYLFRNKSRFADVTNSNLQQLDNIQTSDGKKSMKYSMRNY